MTQLEALKEIYRAKGGELPPRVVIEAARPEDSPLHGAFCWDDTEAAERYRIIQAQELIRSFRVEIICNEKPISVPVFVNLSTDRNGRSEDNPYRMTEDVMKFPDMAEIVVRDALDQMESMRNRYGHLKEFADVWAPIDAHIRKRRKA